MIQNNIDRNWFILTLYTPTPTQFTEDFLYTNEELQCVDIIESEYSYKNEGCEFVANITTVENFEYKEENNYEYIVEENNYTFENKAEVITIEFE